MGKSSNRRPAHPAPTGGPRNPIPTITKKQRRKRNSRQCLQWQGTRDPIPAAALPHARASPLTVGPIVSSAGILSTVTTTATTALNRRRDDHTIKRYCATLSTRKPIYSVRGSSNIGYTCTLTLPQEAPCPIVITYQKERNLAKDVATNAACRVLKQNHEISSTNQPLRPPRQTLTCNFGYKIISAEEREHLGLQSVQLGILRCVLDSRIGDN
ncbi:hypothetical protein BGX27_006351, partial [Mortierella sp. AM989]